MQAMTFGEWLKEEKKITERQFCDNFTGVVATSVVLEYENYLDKFDEQTEECYGKVRIV